MSTSRLSVVIPCFNEASSILPCLMRVRKAIGSKAQVIVVNDGSTDNTAEVLDLEGASYQIDLVTLETNSGKGAALRAGFERVERQIVAVQDADLEYDPSELVQLVELIDSGEADVVYGSRFSSSQKRRVLLFWHSVGNKTLTLLSNMFTNLNLTDMETCYKVFRSDIIPLMNLRENRFGFEPEFTAKVAKLGLRVFEVGVSYAGRTYAEGKKISWLDGISALYCIVRYSFWSRKS